MTRRKKIGFAALTTIGFFLLLEALLTVIHVVPRASYEDPYVGFASWSPLFVEKTDEAGRTVMATAENKLEWFNRQTFPRAKLDNGYRIFCLGGSTTYGRPYDDATSYSAWLREFLPAADSSKSWEVINAGGISYASYRVARVMEELFSYEPDLFVIYTGHNEFLERRTYADMLETPTGVRNLGSWLSGTRTYSLIASLVSDPQNADHSEKELLPAEVNAVLDNSLGPDAYHRDDPLARDILEHYRLNLHRMVALARSKGAEVVLVVPASNLKDSSPFKSEPEPTASAKNSKPADEFAAEAREALRSGDPTEALKAAEAGLKQHPRFAHLHYLRGKALFALERFADAKTAFEKARDEDVCPLRALTEMRRIVLQVAAERDVPCVDFSKILADKSPHQIPGNEWFLDHVHPTIEGHQELGLALMDRLIRQGIVEPTPAWGKAATQQIASRIFSRVDQKAQAKALRNLSKVLGWAGKSEEADRLALQALTLASDDAETQYQAGNAFFNQQKFPQALAQYRRCLELDPGSAPAHYGLGLAYNALGDSEKSLFHYTEALRLNPDFADAHYKLAKMYESRNDLDKAEHHYRETIRLYPEHSLAWNDLGVVHAKRGDYETARKYFTKALAIDPDMAEAGVNLAQILAVGGQTGEAVRQLKQILQKHPDHEVARQMLNRFDQQKLPSKTNKTL